MKKKYRTTKKHPSFKEGGILTKSNHSKFKDHYKLEHGEFLSYVFCDEFILEALLRVGFIEEFIEPEFNKNDMIEFAEYCIQPHILDCNNAFDKWKNEKT